MTVLLKRLDIQGFKSFATATPFVFDRGITAIIGPNGSGKSNVAEALRWVLGEQGHANLRSRRTDDVIFAGSDKRAQQALAEVVLTLDNTDGDLPLPFSEITVTRRAFRGGENQYLINGSRVRLKDVQQLVAPIGQSYTIIGQGLVDAALSQRPEERRGLFEHAAGIAGLRLRANDAERGLAEASANSVRLRDILSELEPRVRQLERQAKMAREYGAVRDRLHDLQRRHYYALWAESTAKVAAERDALDTSDDAFSERERAHTIAAQRLAELRNEDRRLSDDLAALTQRAADRDRAASDARHRLELLDSRTRSADQRAADIRERCAELERENAAAIAQSAGLAHDRERLSAEVATLEHDLAARDAAQEEARRHRAGLRTALELADQQALTLARSGAELEGVLAGLAERRAAVEAQSAGADAAIAREQARRDAASAAIAAAESRAEEHARERERAVAALVAAENDARAIRARMTDERRLADDAARDLTALQARLELLDRTHASGEGLYAGVRAVVRAVRGGTLDLPGLVGAVAEVIETPKELETAIEVALGGHLQDLIVERWDDARLAIDFLKRTQSGRATFQPLDTVRAPRPLALEIRDPDLIGVASELVAFPERVRPVVEQAIGRTLIVRDLDATRRLLDRARGWTLVTLAGEITRPSGAVTGGGRANEAGLLARERERRALPGRVASAIERLADIRDEISVSGREEANAAERIAAERSRVESLSGAQRSADADLARSRADLTTIETAMASAGDQQRHTATRFAELDDAEARAREQITLLRAEHDALAAERSSMATQLRDADTIEVDRASGLRATLAEIRERLRATNIARQQAADRIAATERGIIARRREIEQIESTAQQDAAAGNEIEREIEQLATSLDEANAALPALRKARDHVHEAFAGAERALDLATELIRAAERDRDQSALRLARVQDEQVFLVERIRNDLGVDDPTTLATTGDNDEAAADEAEIARLRDRLRRMSAVGEDVLEQHDAESARLAHLLRQLEDVEQAAGNLRRVLADLNGRMATQFNETFREVAVAFEQTFTRLFGGGMARLALTTSEDGAASIDIVAQPPGKRLQNLTALSGGERSLTAVALLIAIQRVNPSPFCLLDEVDAALDESNVVRFRDELRDLASATQFVVITHNRGTIEGADTLYGVTMSGDGVSRVLSLRLEEAIEAVEAYETASAGG